MHGHRVFISLKKEDSNYKAKIVKKLDAEDIQVNHLDENSLLITLTQLCRKFVIDDKTQQLSPSS